MDTLGDATGGPPKHTETTLGLLGVVPGVLCVRGGFSDTAWGVIGIRRSSSPNLLCTGRCTVNNAAHIPFKAFY